MKRHDEYWFPAKRFGWGWGLPSSWQGWAVVVLYLVALGLLVLFLPPAENGPRFAVGVAISTAMLLAVCWRKGAPPRWRWGGD